METKDRQKPRTGKIVRFNEQRGFGFISSSEFREDLFFHIDEYPEGQYPEDGQVVSFLVGEGKKGPQALQIEPQSSPVDPYIFFYLSSLGIYLVFCIGAYLSHESTLVISHLIGVNTAGFILMGLDKGSARAGGFRVPERVLFTLGAIGGSPALLLAANIFRHKTRKAKFQLTLFIILAAQIVALSKLAPEVLG